MEGDATWRAWGKARWTKPRTYFRERTCFLFIYLSFIFAVRHAAGPDESVSCYEKATSTLTASLFRDASPHRGAVVRWSRSRASCRTASFEVRAVHRLRPAAGGLGDRRPPTKPAPDLSPFSSSGPNVHTRRGSVDGRDPRRAARDSRGSVAAPFRTRSDWRGPLASRGSRRPPSAPPAVAPRGTRPGKGTFSFDARVASILNSKANH